MKERSSRSYRLGNEWHPFPHASVKHPSRTALAHTLTMFIVGSPLLEEEWHTLEYAFIPQRLSPRGLQAPGSRPRFAPANDPADACQVYAFQEPLQGLA